MKRTATSEIQISQKNKQFFSSYESRKSVTMQDCRLQPRLNWIHQASSCPRRRTTWPLKMGRTGSPKMSVSNHFTLLNDPEDGRIRLRSYLRGISRDTMVAQLRSFLIKEPKTQVWMRMLFCDLYILSPDCVVDFVDLRPFKNCSQSRSHVTTDGQLVSLYCWREPPGACD